MKQVFKAVEDGKLISLSDGEFCTKSGVDTICVKIEEAVPYEHMIVSGVYKKDKRGNLNTENEEIDIPSLELLIRELRVEGRIRRIGKLYFDTQSPMTFRLLKRLGFSTTPESKKNSACYIDILEGRKSCVSSKIRLVRKV